MQYSRMRSALEHETRRTATRALRFLLLLVAIGAGCQQNTPQTSEQAPPVPISHPVERPVTDYVDFTGRTDAVQSVNIVARVTGYVVKIAFEEGADVKKGQLLYQIDPQPYEAQVKLGDAQVAANDAQLKFAKQNYKRAQTLKKDDAVMAQEIEQYKSSLDLAIAQLDAAKANLDIYRLNLDYTRVTSPIDGQVSRYFLTLGNLVNQDQTLLTTVVSLDPIYAYFDVDQRTLLRVRSAINEGKVRSRRAPAPGPEFPFEKLLAAQGVLRLSSTSSPLPSALAMVGLAVLPVPIVPIEIPVLLGMPGDSKYPFKGFINFSNNQLNPTTGSIAVRGIFANPRPPNGVRLMSPGMYVRIRLPIGSPRPSLLVLDRVIQSDQGQKYVYVVNSDNKTEYRQIVTGPLQDDGLRVVSSGLVPNDWVVVGALPQLRPNMQVTTQETTMPTFGATARR
jgi:multidrug efflux pump subunit AcrA (membrane-fusion protein)